jgi:cytochrome c oxidase assembly protein subunit 15
MRRYRFWLALATFLTFDLIMFGAFVRGVDAGLGCPDWPGCYGRVSPWGALPQIQIEQAARPTGPVTVFKAWVEMAHRYVAAGLGVVVIGLAIAATRIARAARAQATPADPRPSVVLAWLTVAWIMVQGAFGAWTVTLKLAPAVVTAHLLGGMALLALLQWQRLKVAKPVPVAPEAARLRWGLQLMLGLLGLQIALGGWVSSNYATLACQDFPQCQGQWWPPMAWVEGFELWRPLGATGQGVALPFAALTAIHMAHRLCAALVVLWAACLVARAWRVPGLAHPARVWAGMLLVQIGTGLTTVFLDWPLAVAVLHTGGAAAVLMTVLVLESRSRRAVLNPDSAETGQAGLAVPSPTVALSPGPSS